MLEIYVIVAAVFLAMVLVAVTALVVALVRNTYIEGFRRDALQLISDTLKERDPDLENTPLEKERRQRLRELRRLTAAEAQRSAPIASHDRALAVIAGRHDDERFIEWIVQRRARHQREGREQLQDLLGQDQAANTVIDRYAEWLGTTEARLRKHAYTDVGRLVWRTFQARGEVVATATTLWVLVVPFLILVLVTLVVADADVGSVIVAGSATAVVIVAALAWVPLTARAVHESWAHVPRSVVRKGYQAMAFMIVSATATVSLLELGVVNRFWEQVDTMQRKLEPVHMSAQLVLAVTVAVIDVIAVVACVVLIREVLDRGLIAWQRVRAASFVAATLSVVPLSAWMWSSVPHGRLDTAPAWVAVSFLGCLAIGLVVYVAAVAMRALARASGDTAAPAPPRPIIESAPGASDEPAPGASDEADAAVRERVTGDEAARESGRGADL